MTDQKQIKDTNYFKTNSILAHTYSWYFFLLLLGVFLDILFPIRVFHSTLVAPVGFSLLTIATVLIIWAESTHHHRLAKEHVEEHGKKALCKGPYCYTRHPTHWGIFLLLIGFGVFLNAFFVMLLTLFSFIFAKLTFLKKHDLVMLEKFGGHYKDYKKSVRL